MIHNRKREGQRGNLAVLGIASVLAVGFVGGMAIDLGSGYRERWRAQTVADGALMAALHELANNVGSVTDQQGFVQDVARKYGALNGFPDQCSACGPSVRDCSCITVEPPLAVSYRNTDAAHPDFRLTAEKHISTTLSNVFRVAKLGTRDHITIQAKSVARLKEQGIGILALNVTRRDSLTVRGRSHLSLRAGMVLVNSNDGRAVRVDNTSSLDTGVPLRTHGQVFESGNLTAANAPPAQGYANPNFVENDIAPTYKDPFRVDGPHPVPEIPSTNNARDLPEGWTERCGLNTNACDAVKLLIYDAPNGGLHQSKRTILDPAGGTCACPPSEWGDDGGAGNAGVVTLCPGIYYGGMIIRNRKVRFAPCSDPICQGLSTPCTGKNVTDPLFIVAGGGLKLRNTIGNPLPVDQASSTALWGQGVTIFQTKHGRGGYGRLQFDKNSDVDIIPPVTGTFRGVPVYVDRDYAKATAISARALSGIRGDIYAKNSTLFIMGRRRRKKAADFGLPDLDRLTVSLIAGSVKFGGRMSDDGETDQEDEDDTSTDETDDFDPDVMFSAESAGSSALTVVMGIPY